MWHNDVSYMNVQKFCPHSPRRPFAVLLFRPLRGRGVGFLSLLGLWGALGTCHICCIRRGQSSLGVSALLLCRRGCGARGVVQQWHFFLLAPFCNLRGFVKHDNILRNMNFGNLTYSYSCSCRPGWSFAAATRSLHHRLSCACTIHRSG